MIEQYYCLGYVTQTSSVRYVFVNPFRTETTEDVDAFKDHVRDIPVVFANGEVDEEATLQRVEEVGRGVWNKMKIAAEAYAPEEGEAVEAALDLFGEAYEEPAPVVEDEPAPEGEV